MYISHTLCLDASNYASSSIVTQGHDVPNDLRPIAYTSSSFSDMQQRWSKRGKEDFAFYQSILKFVLYLRGGAQCILYCDHKPLEPFLSYGMKIL